jgi:hypothetical protein
VDLHRETLFFVIVDADGTELLVRRFPATAAGEAELLRHLQPGTALSSKLPAERIALRIGWRAPVPWW